jgi:hypothetical protein
VPQYNSPPLTDAQKKDRIKIGDKYYKMTYDEYLNRMDGDPVNRPFAEMDAGIGQAIANLKDTIIVSYKSETPTVYIPEAIYRNSKYNSGTFPLNKIIFLYNKGQNHYDLLKLNPGNETSERWPRPAAGGGQEFIDLGVAVVRRFTRRNKNRNHK